MWVADGVVVVCVWFGVQTQKPPIDEPNRGASHHAWHRPNLELKTAGSRRPGSGKGGEFRFLPLPCPGASAFEAATKGVTNVCLPGSMFGVAEFDLWQHLPSRSC